MKEESFKISSQSSANNILLKNLTFLDLSNMFYIWSKCDTRCKSYSTKFRYNFGLRKYIQRLYYLFSDLVSTLKPSEAGKKKKKYTKKKFTKKYTKKKYTKKVYKKKSHKSWSISIWPWKTVSNTEILFFNNIECGIMYCFSFGF